MRKYQQLVLVVIAIISFTVLCVYKFENNRLRDVLDVVNFFGRNDADIRIEADNYTFYTSQFNFETPLPVWQRIGNNFYSYSTFFQKNLLSVGGSVVSLVVGSKNEPVNFKCDIKFSDNTVVKGKFGFFRVETTSAETNIDKEDFFIYKFICKYTRDFGIIPKDIIYSHIKIDSNSHKLPIRHISSKDVKAKLLFTVCLDLNEYDSKLSNSNFINTTTILQYFLHYKIIGVDEFLLYSTNYVDHHIKNILIKYGIKFNILPFNFPFDMIDKQKIFKIIEMDCLLRNINLSKYTIITKLNNYLYPNTKLTNSNNILKIISKNSNDITRYEVDQKSICIDERKRIFSDNLSYNVNLRNAHKFFIYKPENYKNEYVKSIKLDETKMTLHNYVYCNNKTGSIDWRITLDSDYLHYINEVGRDISKLLV